MIGIERVKVWDEPTRVFHWAIVSLVAFSWFTADRGLMRLHLWSGLALLALLIFRIAWGICGSTTARFSNFVTGPGAVLAYLRALTRRQRPLHAGHNPAGGWMVVVLVTLLLTQVCIGLLANDGIHFTGPLATLVSDEMSDRLTELHGAVFNFILLLVYFHLVAVFFYLFVKDENLIKPMLTGYKHRDHLPPKPALEYVHWAVALLVFAASAVTVTLLLRALQ